MHGKCSWDGSDADQRLRARGATWRFVIAADAAAARVEGAGRDGRRVGPGDGQRRERPARVTTAGSGDYGEAKATAEVNNDRVVVGEYTTLRDGGLTYTYAGAWIDAGARYGWYVTVRRMGEWKGSPSGSFPNRPGVEPSAAVRRLAESSIEALIQVQK